MSPGTHGRDMSGHCRGKQTQIIIDGIPKPLALLSLIGLPQAQGTSNRSYKLLFCSRLGSKLANCCYEQVRRVDFAGAIPFNGQWPLRRIFIHQFTLRPPDKRPCPHLRRISLRNALRTRPGDWRKSIRPFIPSSNSRPSGSVRS